MIQLTERWDRKGESLDKRETPFEARTDEQLMADLLQGRQEALQVLHRRLAPLVFHVACRTLDAPAAEEITQDVFLRIWQKADRFDADRGTVRSWVLQITHHRVLNELRHRGRRPKVDEYAEPSLVDLSAHDPAPDEHLWNEYQKSAIQRALRALPPAQAQALRLAFFQNLTHEEVAGFLNVPLGTAKSRIRMALEKLNPRLAALVAMLVAGLGLSTFEWLRHRRARSQDERALAMLTSSHMEMLRLLPPTSTGDPEHGPHATYRAERGGSILVLTLSDVPQLQPGETYRMWQLNSGSWKLLGAFTPDTQGRHRALIDAPGLPWPEALQLTREPQGAKGVAPQGPAILAWPPTHP